MPSTSSTRAPASSSGSFSRLPFGTATQVSNRLLSAYRR